MKHQTSFSGSWLRNILAAALTVFAVWAGSSQMVLAQQAGGIVIDLPDVRNYVAVGVGAIPDYMGSDNYTVGIGPAGLLKFGRSERFARLQATE